MNSLGNRRWHFGAGVLGLCSLVAACSGPSGSAPNEPATPKPAVTLSADPLQGEAPLIVNFTANAEGTGADVSYRWSFGDAEATDGSRSRPHVYTEPGRYTARVVVTGEAGGAAGEAAIEVLESTVPRNISNVPPTVTLAASVVDPQNPLSVSFLAAGQDTPDETLSYLLDFGDGNRTTQASAKHLYAAPGRYLATVVVRDTHNTVAVAEAEVVVRD